MLVVPAALAVRGKVAELDKDLSGEPVKPVKTVKPVLPTPAGPLVGSVLSPQTWKQAVSQLLSQPDRALRAAGGVMVAAGLAALWWVRS